jgi:Tol biopolymer transport system component
MRFKVFGTTLATLALAVSLAGQDAAREKKLQQAIDLLEAKGNAAAAMPLLEEVAKSSDQALAARALLYLGQAQERQGNDAARATYERIVRQFASQRAVVEQAKARLGALGGVGGPRAASVTHRHIWTLPGRTITYGNVSRDGRFLVFSDVPGDLYLRDLSTGTTRTLLRHEGDSYVETAALSPDGQHVAFSWFNVQSDSYELHTARIGPTGLIENKTIPGIRGEWIGVHDWTADNRLVAIDMSPTDSPAEVHVVNVVDGSRKVLKSGSGLRVNRLVFSPDGKALALNLRAPENGALDISLIAITGGMETPVVIHRADDVLVGFAPDGRLLFTSDRTGTAALYALSVSTGAASQEPTLLRSSVGSFESRGTAANGALFSVVDPEPPASDIHLGTYDFSAGQWVQPPREVVREYFVGGNESPVWSPDGQTLAYVSRRGDASRAFYSINLRSIESGRVRELKPALMRISAIGWAPGGRSLVVTGTNFESRLGLWQMDLETAELTLIDGQSNWGPSVLLSWSPDGSKMYLRRNISATEGTLVERSASGTERELVRAPRSGQQALQGTISRDGNRLFYRRVVPGAAKPAFTEAEFIERDLATGNERVIAHGYLAALNMSPDGQHFATGLNDPGTGVRLFGVMPTSGGPLRELIRAEIPKEVLAGTASTNVLAMAGWAPDSRSFFVRRAVGEKAELWWVPITAGAPPRRIVEDWRGISMRMHPDGRRVVFQIRQQSAKPSELWVLENLLPARQVKPAPRP